MAKKQIKYDIKNLPFPIRPGDQVYFVLEDGSIEADKATSVGINEDGRILIMCGQDEYEVGVKDGAFLSEEDAEKYVENPDAISEDYGEIDYSDMDLPYYPGTDFYYCDYDGFMNRWEIFEEHYTYVYFDMNGEVRVGDGDSECTVIGKNVDPCFDTPRKAQAYVRSRMRED